MNNTLTWPSVIDLADNPVPPASDKVSKTPQEWRQQLSAEQFYVTREHGTERAFSNDMCSAFEPGRYACVCCANVLFDGAEKFESGTGWPSFTQPASTAAVSYKADHSHGMTRIEALCNVCDAHLGHVFPDGPAPSGLRYCMNAVSLTKA